MVFHVVVERRPIISTSGQKCFSDFCRPVGALRFGAYVSRGLRSWLFSVAVLRMDERSVGGSRASTHPTLGAGSLVTLNGELRSGEPARRYRGRLVRSRRSA